jgi:hypothetical protein
MSVSARLISAIAVSLCVAGFCAEDFGQTLTSARIAGTVRDIQGATVANAEVTAEDCVSRKPRSVCGEGNYTSPAMPISLATVFATLSAIFRSRSPVPHQNVVHS